MYYHPNRFIDNNQVDLKFKFVAKSVDGSHSGQHSGVNSSIVSNPVVRAGIMAVEHPDMNLNKMSMHNNVQLPKVKRRTTASKKSKLYRAKARRGLSSNASITNAIQTVGIKRNS